jgi:hypothetical protein
VIGGQVLGSASDPGRLTGFFAEQIRSLSIAGTQIPLHLGPHNDDITIGVLGTTELEEA